MTGEVSTPSGATENTDTEPPELAVASSRPDGLNATETGKRAGV